MNKKPSIVPYAGCSIWNHEEVAYCPRTEFLQSLCGVIAVSPPTPLEDIVISTWEKQVRNAVRRVAAKNVEVTHAVVSMARDYRKYAGMKARLPKFSRWATGMFPSDQDLAQTLATLGQAKAAVGELRISTDCFDIMRAGASPHFSSCFVANGIGGESLLAIAEHNPGIAVAFVNDVTGVMKGRTWIYHVKRKQDGVDGVLLSGRPYGSFDEATLIRALKDKNIPVFKPGWAGQVQEIEVVGIGPQFYNDTSLWGVTAALLQ